jgi:hypothetical protein
MKAQWFYCHDSMRTLPDEVADVYLSLKFCNWISTHFTELMQKEAGLTPSSKVNLAWGNYLHKVPMYEAGTISKLNVELIILPMWFRDAISFCWRSKSGKIVHTYDEDFDEADLECWMEGLKPQLYLEQVSKVSTDHPMKVKDLPYEFVVYGFGTHMQLAITLSNEDSSPVAEALSAEIEKHNEKSEAKGRAMGVIHNHYFEKEGNQLVLRIDIGSAGVAFIKKLLNKLATFPQVKKVVADV